MTPIQGARQVRVAAVVFTLALCLAACSESARRGAAGGAATGAVASSVGTLVTGLVFHNGNLGESVARSAVYGATAGATVGAIAGSRHDAPADKPAAKTATPAPQAPLTREKVLATVGPTNVEALQALSACDHGKAVTLAKQAMQSMNRQHRQAALWIQSIAAIETGDTVTLDELQDQLISNDPALKDPQTADRILGQAMDLLKQDRIDQGRAPTCPA